MTAALFVVGILALAFAGVGVLRFRSADEMDGPARFSLCFAMGTFAAALLLYAMSLSEVSWSRTVCGSLLVLIGIGGAFLARGRHGERVSPRLSAAAALSIAIIGIMTYAAVGARATCADLYYFWGPKGQAFFLARKINPAFLSFPNHYLMHPDYPPLLPLLYAWGSLVAHAMSWWGAVLLTPLFLFLSAAFFRGVARPVIGNELADRYALLFTAVLGFGYIAASAAGAGEPPLLFYETVAVAALTFCDVREVGTIVIAVAALAAVVFLKVEGAAFVAVVAGAFLVTRRRIGAAVALAGFPAALLASWLLFARHHQLLDSYLSRERIHWDVLPQVLRETVQYASYEAWYVPWLAALATLPFGRNWRRAAFPLLVAGGAATYTVYFYLHTPAPKFWIASSASRVLLTSLMTLVVASAAAQPSDPSNPARGEGSSILA